MGRKLHVGSLPYSTNRQALAERFGQYGSVDSPKPIKNRETRRGKGFGFVEI